jgi:hypothetical protein
LKAKEMISEVVLMKRSCGTEEEEEDKVFILIAETENECSESTGYSQVEVV